MPAFFSSSPLHPATLVLDKDESRHLASALRLRSGELVTILDGAGRRAQARITLADPKASQVEILQVEEIPRPACELHLYIVPPANAILHDILRQGTELGLSHFHLVQGERSVSLPKDKDFSPELVAACKQSFNPHLPRIHPLRPLPKLLSEGVPPGFFGHLPAGPRPDWRRHLPNPLPPALSLWVGPEGGFSPAEIQLLHSAGLQPISLGHHVLRSETAAISLSSLLIDALS